MIDSIRIGVCEAGRHMEPKSYIVCSTVRSGSTLLSKTLEQLGGCGQPYEYFHRHRIKALKLNHNPDAFLKYCSSIFLDGMTYHSVFGVKMHWWQMFDFLNLARQSIYFQQKQDFEILNTLFPNLKFIYLWRRDTTAQSVSAAIAAQTGQWEKADQGKSEYPLQNRKNLRNSRVSSIKFQPWKIYEWEKNLKYQNQCWRQFFQDNCLNFYEITYEDLIDSFDQKVTHVIDHIGIDKNQLPGKIEMSMKRQFTPINRQFIRYYTSLPKPFWAVVYRLYHQLKISRDGVV